MDTAPEPDFCPRVRDDVEITFFKEDERGTFYLVRNPCTQRYLKLHQEAVNLLRKMDGTASVSQLQEETPELTVGDVVAVLARGGFLEGIEPKKKEEPFYTVKIPFFKSNARPLLQFYRCFFWMASTPFKVFYGLFVGLGATLFLWNAAEIFDTAVLTFDLTTPLTPLLIIILVGYTVEIAHELAHTGVSFYYGAEPGDIGIVFHFLVAFFYVETPDTRKLSDKGSVMTFLAGPLTSLFAAEVCTYLYVFTDSMPLVWGGAALFWHLSVLITLSPFMQTDGYYLLQHMLRFPNLFKHATKYVRLNVCRAFKRISEEDYTKKMSIYTERELKILRAYSLFLPVQIGILSFVFFFMAFKIKIVQVFQLAPLILSGGNPYGAKGYVLLGAYSLSLTLMTLAAVLTVWRGLKKET